MGRGPGEPENGSGSERQGGECGSAEKARRLGHARYLSMNDGAIADGLR
jgi:hypothetical protein